MTTGEIRQKAIECGKADLEFCSEHHCDDCCLIDVNPCNHVRAYEHGFADGVEEGKQLAAKWIPVTVRLPENEETVLITVERRPIGGKPCRRVTKAFYEDGNMNTEVSDYCWDTSEGDWKYDEESDGYIIPEGWYCAYVGIVDDFVLAWMPLPKPFEGGESHDE